jgi:hypothetical protein
MIRALLLSVMLFQAAQPGPSKPIIDNERVTVWNVPSSMAANDTGSLDSVVVSSSGKAAFFSKGKAPQVDGRSLVIALKDHPVPPIQNTSGYPLGFPRPGAKKLLENDRVIVWDYTWQPGVPTPMHFHDKDVVVWFLEDGDLKSTTPDGKDTVNQYTADTIKFNQRNRSHSETLVKGKQRALITELK